EQLIGWRDEAVEHARLLNLIAAADPHVSRELPRQFRIRALLREIEAGSNLLLDGSRHGPVGFRIEDPRLTVRADDPVGREAVAGVGRRGLAGQDRRILRIQADAREKVHRTVLAEQIAPPDLERRLRRNLELLDGGARILRAADDAQAYFEAA